MQAVKSYLDTQLRLNQTVSQSNTDVSLFHLYLAMLERDQTQQPQIEADFDEIPVDQSLPEHHYRHPSYYNEGTASFVVEQYQLFLACDALSSLRLWSAMHPLPLSANSKACDIDADVIANMPLWAQQRYADTEVDAPLAQQTEAQDPTLLFDLIPQAEQFQI